MATERVGVMELGGKAVTVIGDDVQTGQVAPTFSVVASNWAPVDVLASSAGKMRVLVRRAVARHRCV